MIISRAPVRITLGGGGTDLASYYSKYGGFMITAAINKYVFVAANKRFYESIRLSYAKTEIAEDISSIVHSRFREALRLLGPDKGIELVSIADVPANCGLGTSSSFTVSTLNALHMYRRDPVSARQLAEEACNIEIQELGEPIGKQDQYAAAFGGVICINIEKDGTVATEPLKISYEKLDDLNSNIHLFYTGIERSAADILVEQNDKSKSNSTDMIENLHRIKEIGLASKKALEKGNLDEFGELLHVHWEDKKKRSLKVTNPMIDECYEAARECGALGGKLVGAGGGGFLMIYCNSASRDKLFEKMKSMQLKPMRFHFDFEGAKIMLNSN